MATPAPARDEEVVRVKLPSGARLLVKRDPSVGLVAMRAVWMGGLRYEDARTNGVNNLLAALVTRGTRTRTGDELAHEVEAHGRLDRRLLRAQLVRPARRDAGAPLGARARAPRRLHPRSGVQPTTELEKERRQALEEIRTQADNVSSEAFRLFQQTLYRQHPVSARRHRHAPIRSPA